MAALSVLSLEYVRVPVSATESGAAVNPTSDAVTMAFPPLGTRPATGDWKTAEWEIAGSTYSARCLVGPGGTVTLPTGQYDVWVKVTDNPEVPAMPAGQLTVF